MFLKDVFQEVFRIALPTVASTKFICIYLKIGYYMLLLNFKMVVMFVSTVLKIQIIIEVS